MKIKKVLSSVKFSLMSYAEEGKAVLAMCGVAIIMRVVQPFLGILMPKIVLDQLEAQADPQRFILIVGGMALAITAAGFVRALADRVADNGVGTLGIGTFMSRQWAKWMTMDYQLMEDPGFKAAEDKAQKATYSNHAPAFNIPRSLVELCANVLGFVLYAVVIAAVHPVILLVLLLSAAVSWVVVLRVRQYDERTRETRSKIWNRLEALNKKLREPESAKDMRLYPVLKWISDVYGGQQKELYKEERSVLTKQMYAQITDALLVLLRDGAAYAVLIWFVLDGRMSLGTFVYVFAAIGALAGWVTGALKAASDLFKSSVELDDVRAMLEYPDRMNRGAGEPLPGADALPPAIELRNVSYRYPKAEKPTLSNVNVSIRPGERLAIVGANGAGKTTLVKLLCGLYMPSEGEVLLNGRSSVEYNRDEYYTLFSTVFQDIHMTASSIAENVSQKVIELTDMEKVRRSIELTGFAQKVASLPEKERTLLVRQVNADATELSGGEKQKLAMARAVYKDAPVIILDEPTAALDPIAENEVYNKYAELTEGKTSVFISHRLASTRFCDRILLIDGGEITEQGSHDELMALGGVYANMFNVQASYYKSDSKFEWGVAK